MVSFTICTSPNPYFGQSHQTRRNEQGLWHVQERVLVGKPEGKRPLERPRHRWKNNIKWILKK
jgi:hypothetical protein